MQEIVDLICLNQVLAQDVNYQNDPALQINIRRHFIRNIIENCIEKQSNDMDCIFEHFDKKDNHPDLTPYPAHVNDDIKSKIDRCFANSFERTSAESIKPNPHLDDNKLLREELETFKKVSGFEHFPLLKINGLNYNGRLNMLDLKVFICQEILSKSQCDFSKGTIAGAIAGYWALYTVVGSILGLFLLTLFVCKRRLKERYETELNLKIDQSIAGFLDK